MKTHLVALVVAFAVGLVAAPRAEAGKFTFSRAGVTIDIPDSWVIDDQSGHVTFQTPDQTLAINLAWGGDDLDAAWKLLVDQVGKVVTGVKVTKNDGALGGMSGYVSAGKGTLQGTKVDVLLAVIKTPSAAMTVFAIGEQGKYEKHEAAMTKVLNSIAAIGGGASRAPAGNEKSFGDDASYQALDKKARKLADQWLKVLVKQDQKGLIKLAGKAGVTFSDGDGESLVMKGKQLKAALKKDGSVTRFLGLPDAGAWHVLIELVENDILAFSIYRGELTGLVAHLYFEVYKGKWRFNGVSMRDHGE